MSTNALLWTMQIICAALFVRYGIRKTTTPKEILRHRIAWVDEYSEGFVKFVGTVEILGGLGLVLPAATRIAPILTPIAAVGLAILMILGGRLHLRRIGSWSMTHAPLTLTQRTGRWAAVPFVAVRGTGWPTAKRQAR